MEHKLLAEAKELLEEKYNPPVHSVAAALALQSGEVIRAVNLDHFLGFACAETAALVMAINQGKYDLQQIVAVRKNDAGEIVIANMCGRCRQVYHDYAPGIEVITDSGVKKIEELLPNAFTRQRDKVQAVLGKGGGGF